MRASCPYSNNTEVKMFDANDTAGIQACLLAFQNRCAQGLGSRGNNCDLFVQLAITIPGQQGQVLTAGAALNSMQARTSPSSFVTENFNHDDADKHLAGLAAIT